MDWIGKTLCIWTTLALWIQKRQKTLRNMYLWFSGELSVLAGLLVFFRERFFPRYWSYGRNSTIIIVIQAWKSGKYCFKYFPNERADALISAIGSFLTFPFLLSCFELVDKSIIATWVCICSIFLSWEG